MNVLQHRIEMQQYPEIKEQTQEVAALLGMDVADMLAEIAAGLEAADRIK